MDGQEEHLPICFGEGVRIDEKWQLSPVSDQWRHSAIFVSLRLSVTGGGRAGLAKRWGSGGGLGELAGKNARPVQEVSQKWMGRARGRRSDVQIRAAMPEKKTSEVL